jgi:hypothetical protein
MPYRLAADLVLMIHAAFIAYVVGALVATMLGWWRGWRWIRNPWFRGSHLLCIAYVVLEAWLDMDCPLTVWENSLRLRAGQETYESAGCIAHWLHRLIFFRASPWVFTTCYTLFGLLVVAMMVLAPPQWKADRLPRVSDGKSA